MNEWMNDAWMNQWMGEQMHAVTSTVVFDWSPRRPWTMSGSLRSKQTKTPSPSVSSSFCIVLYCIVLCCIVLYCIVLYCIVLYCIVMCCVALYSIVLYCIVLSKHTYPAWLILSHPLRITWLLTLAWNNHSSIQSIIHWRMNACSNTRHAFNHITSHHTIDQSYCRCFLRLCACWGCIRRPGQPIRT